MILANTCTRARPRKTLTPADRRALREATQRARQRIQIDHSGGGPVRLGEIIDIAVRRILARAGGDSR